MTLGVQIPQKCSPRPQPDIWDFSGNLSSLFTKILDCPHPEKSLIFPIEVDISSSPKFGENRGILIIPQ